MGLHYKTQQLLDFMRANPDMSIPEVIKARNTSETRVKRIAKQFDLPNPKGYKSETLDFMRANPEMSVSEIAQARKISTQAVYSLMKRHGLDHRVRETYARGQARVNHEEIETIANDVIDNCDKEYVLRRNGLSQAEKTAFADKYGVNNRVMTKVSVVVLERLTSERNLRILDDLRSPNRMKDTEIAMKHGVSAGIVARVRDENGISRLPRQNAERSNSMRQRVREYVATKPKATINDIARDLGMNISQARILFMELDTSRLPITPQQRKMIEKELRKPNRDTDLVIAHKIGVHSMAVNILRRSLGIEALSTKRGSYTTTQLREMRKEITESIESGLDSEVVD